MKRTFLLIAIAILLTLNSCTSDKAFDTGKQQLESMGYTNVTNTGYNAFCCSDEDTFSTGFEATDRNGNEVTGCFCSGAFKGVTIRFD